MHGHVLPMPSSELSMIESVRQVTIELALVNEDPGLPCIIVVVHIQVTILKSSKPIRTIEDEDQVQRSAQQDFCSITNPTAFASHFNRFKLRAESPDRLLSLFIRCSLSIDSVIKADSFKTYCLSSEISRSYMVKLFITKVVDFNQ